MLGIDIPTPAGAKVVERSQEVALEKRWREDAGLMGDAAATHAQGLTNANWQRRRSELATLTKCPRCPVQMTPNHRHAVWRSA